MNNEVAAAGNMGIMQLPVGQMQNNVYANETNTKRAEFPVLYMPKGKRTIDHPETYNGAMRFEKGSLIQDMFIHLDIKFQVECPNNTVASGTGVQCYRFVMPPGWGFSFLTKMQMYYNSETTSWSYDSLTHFIAHFRSCMDSYEVKNLLQMAGPAICIDMSASATKGNVKIVNVVADIPLYTPWSSIIPDKFGFLCDTNCFAQTTGLQLLLEFTELRNIVGLKKYYVDSSSVGSWSAMDQTALSYTINKSEVLWKNYVFVNPGSSIGNILQQMPGTFITHPFKDYYHYRVPNFSLTNDGKESYIDFVLKNLPTGDLTGITLMLMRRKDYGASFDLVKGDPKCVFRTYNIYNVEILTANNSQIYHEEYYERPAVDQFSDGQKLKAVMSETDLEYPSSSDIIQRKMVKNTSRITTNTASSKVSYESKLEYIPRSIHFSQHDDSIFQTAFDSCLTVSPNAFFRIRAMVDYDPDNTFGINYRRSYSMMYTDTWAEGSTVPFGTTEEVYDKCMPDFYKAGVQQTFETIDNNTHELHVFAGYNAAVMITGQFAGVVRGGIGSTPF